MSAVKPKVQAESVVLGWTVLCPRCGEPLASVDAHGSRWWPAKESYSMDDEICRRCAGRVKIDADTVWVNQDVEPPALTDGRSP